MHNFYNRVKHIRFMCFCIIMMLMMIIPSLATEKTGVWFSIYTDDGIQFTEDDTYEVKLMNKDTKDTEEVTIKAQEAARNFYEVELPEGIYSVVDLQYNGPNKELSNLSIAVSNNFESSDMFDTVDIGVGNESALFIDSQHINAYVYSSDKAVYEEFRSPEYKEEETEPIEEVRNETSVVQVDKEKELSEKPQKEVKKNNYLIGFLPVVIIGFIVGSILYILRKKKKI